MSLLKTVFAIIYNSCPRTIRKLYIEKQTTRKGLVIVLITHILMSVLWIPLWIALVAAFVIGTIGMAKDNKPVTTIFYGLLTVFCTICIVIHSKELIDEIFISYNDLKMHNESHKNQVGGNKLR